MGSAALQRLIFQGRVLTDDVVLGSLNLTEKDFIVLMVAKVHRSGFRRAEPI